MKEKILNLRYEGKTYNEIVEILGCSKSLVSYYCGKDQKQKNLVRQKKSRSNKYTCLYRKLIYFQKRDDKNRNYDKSKPINFSFKEFKDKYPINSKCYLSGEEVNLTDSKNWELDHIIPKSKGGNNSLENLGILHKVVNQMKGGLLNEEFIEWCKKILEYQGYIVKK